MITNKNSDFVFINHQVLDLIRESKSFQKDPKIYANYHSYREITFQRMKEIISLGIIKTRDIISNPDTFFSVMNTLHLYDLSLAIKTGVNFGLFGTTLIRYGSVKQSEPYISKLDQGLIFGALAITEIGHGSNLQKLQTTATYDPILNGFRINTPTPDAKKCWIGNAACHATYAIVFAQLILHDKCYGLHAFLVQLRDEVSCDLMPGIIIEDNGLKKGLNGVDNGKITFDNVFIAREMLLENFGYVDEHGNYHLKDPSHANPNRRFGDFLSTLSGGRGVLAVGSNIVSIKALMIACKYGQFRRQFNLGEDKNTPEKQIIRYSTHYCILMPFLAETIALQHALNYLKNIAIDDFNNSGGKVTEYVHMLSSGLKMICSEHAEKCCAKARYLCGSNGYDPMNEISLMQTDIDIYRTFEGDNTLLRLQVSQYVQKILSKKVGQKKFDQVLFMTKSYLQGTTNTIKNYLSVPDIEDPNYLRWMLEYRYKYLVLEIITDTRTYIKQGLRKAEILNKCLIKICELADSYIYRKVFDIFTKIPESLGQPYYEQLILLFGYQLILKDGTWYLTNNLIDNESIVRMKNQMQSISEEISTDINLNNVLNHFGVPELFWKVPMLTEHFGAAENWKGNL